MRRWIMTVMIISSCHLGKGIKNRLDKRLTYGKNFERQTYRIIQSTIDHLKNVHLGGTK